MGKALSRLEGVAGRVLGALVLLYVVLLIATVLLAPALIVGGIAALIGGSWWGMVAGVAAAMVTLAIALVGRLPTEQEVMASMNPNDPAANPHPAAPSQAMSDFDGRLGMPSLAGGFAHIRSLRRRYPAPWEPRQPR